MPTRRLVSGSSTISARPSIDTPRNVLYDCPSSIITVIVGSRRRLTAFCDLAFVSNQISPSSHAYHIATRCGRPSGSTVAIVAVRLRSMNSPISSSLMTIFERSFLPTSSILSGRLGGDRHRDAVECAVARRLVNEVRRRQHIGVHAGGIV